MEIGTTYIMTLKEDDHGHWTEQLKVSVHPLDATVKIRNITKREIFYQK